jgi:hypothetical protein
MSDNKKFPFRTTEVNTEAWHQIMTFMELAALEKLNPNDQEFGNKARKIIRQYNERERQKNA